MTTSYLIINVNLSGDILKAAMNVRRVDICFDFFLSIAFGVMIESSLSNTTSMANNSTLDKT